MILIHQEVLLYQDQQQNLQGIRTVNHEQLAQTKEIDWTLKIGSLETVHIEHREDKIRTKVIATVILEDLMVKELPVSLDDSDMR